MGAAGFMGAAGIMTASEAGDSTMKASAAVGSVATKGFMAVASSTVGEACMEAADFMEVVDSTVAVDFMEVAATVDTDN